MAPGKRLLGCLLVVLSMAASAASEADPAGRYVLNGVREMDSALLIRSDGTFAAAMAFGNVEGRVQGRWQRQGEILILQGAQGHSEIAELINGTRLTLDGACLLRDMGEYQACYLRQPELPYDAWRLGYFAPRLHGCLGGDHRRHRRARHYFSRSRGGERFHPAARRRLG